MIAGNSTNSYITDVKYNMTPEMLHKLAQTKKALTQLGKTNSNANWAAKYFEDTFLPNVYNIANGNPIQSAQFKRPDGEKIEAWEEATDFINIVGESAKYEQGNTLEKIVNSMYNRYQSIIEETEQKEQQKTQSKPGDPSKKEQREAEELQEALSKYTCSQEESEVSKDKLKQVDNGLLDMPGYKQLLKWLNKITKTEVSKKKAYKPISKMSDLQKVSVVEFAKPKALLMKKIVNQELYVKKIVENERFMYTMIDNSGSMDGRVKKRNTLMTQVFKDCTSVGIQLNNCFWNTHLNNGNLLGPKMIRTEQSLKTDVLSIQPDGDDCMGRCVVEKLKLLTKKKEKQYLLCISDGTGSIYDDAESELIYNLAREKNVDVKFALFSSENDVRTIKNEDIFYIYRSYS
jgi:hypothetical protein